jgi:hypothetical protein
MLLLLCGALGSTAFAQQSLTAEQLDLMKKTAADVCNTIKGAPVGKSSKAQIEGQMDAKLSGLAGKLLDLGASTKGSRTSEEFEGLSREATALALQGDRECRASLFSKMLDRMSSAQEQRPGDQTALRLDAEQVTQAVPLIDNAQPKIAGEPVFCETAKLTLVVAHNQEGKRPILVNAITLHVEPFVPAAAAPAPNCEIDPLQTKPFGIVLRQSYLFDATGKALTGRFIASAQPGAAQPVSPQNILKVGNENKSISLKPDEEPVAWDVYVTLDKPGLYRVWFSADYDAGGSRTTETKKFILAK